MNGLICLREICGLSRLGVEFKMDFKVFSDFFKVCFRKSGIKLENFKVDFRNCKVLFANAPLNENGIEGSFAERLIKNRESKIKWEKKKTQK